MPEDIFYAIADPTRREILKLLSGKDMPVHALAEQFPISRPAVSKHLRILHDVGLVTEQKHGRQRLYHFEPKPLREVRDWAAYFDRFWHKKLGKLKEYVKENP